MTGIYFLLHKKKVVYVGQSKNLPARIGNHKDKIYDAARMIKCNKSRLDYYENRFINLFTPKYNKNQKRFEKASGSNRAIQIKLSGMVETMLSKMCSANRRTVSNQISFAVLQHYYRQFHPSKVITDHF